ncbi:MAG: hypothetical protein A3K19_01340 [Lentisphaerae bacterium RIFOXYB12_FULL_65_16]|nr:MAG: hypothetical protein A3K18_06220 [Lentisphaerae bacterium RIFOXYA12_64_32]OGV92541.1 MAG: hypothetical protein A3K19_01340 [Lentisphaerae bacterium RIFOXYB12_FULL_65_16]
MLNENVFAYRSFNPELETVKAFAGFGVDWVCIYPSNTLNSLGMPYSVYEPTWLGLDHYDFEPLDRQIQELRAANPRVQIICMIDLNSPPWFERRCGADDTFYRLGKIASLPQWREATRNYLQAFLRHTEANYADSIRAYMLSCGGTCEWQERSFGDESRSRRAAFRTWAQDQGMPDPVDIPSASIREHISHDLLRDPQVDAAALAYWRFCHWQIGDTILYFAHAAREIIARRAELGLFYGYTLEYGPHRLVSEGHLDYERVFASPDIDFSVAPGSYRHRQMGGTSPFLVPVGTLKQRGKAFIQELDMRTHTSKRPAPWYKAAFDCWHNEVETVAGLQREFSFCLTEDVSFWWFDMWGGFYETASARAALAQMKQIWNTAQTQKHASAAQIALIVDPDSALYLDQNDRRIDAFNSGLAHALHHTGAPHRAFSWGDLPDLDLAPFRLVIFPYLFVMDAARRRLLEEKVLRDNRTVLWLYRPGVVCDGTYDEAGMQRLTGVSVDQPGITTCAMGAWTSVVSVDPKLTPCELRNVARQAGVHIYSDTDEPLYASHRYVALHTATGGDRRIALPRTCAAVTELFSGRVVGRNVNVIDDTLATPGTALYDLD